MSLQKTLEQALHACQRLSPSDTRHLLDDYFQYRVGQVLSERDFAKRAGVPESAIQDLFAQQQTSDDDLHAIARSIDVSPELLSEIAGYHEMSHAMLQTLDRFFKAMAGYRTGQRKAHAA